MLFTNFRNSFLLEGSPAFLSASIVNVAEVLQASLSFTTAPRNRVVASVFNTPLPFPMAMSCRKGSHGM